MRHALGVVEAISATLVGIGVLLVVGLVLVVRAPAIEARLLPVWSQMSIEWEPADGDDLLGALYGYKDRGECRLVEIVAEVASRGYWLPAEITIAGRPPGKITRATGWQSLGLWRFHLREQDRRTPQVLERLRLSAHYQCHDWWLTPARLGEWPTPTLLVSGG